MAGSRKRKPRVPGWQGLEFSGDDLKYDPEEFFVPSHDAQGHSASRSFRVMPLMASEMDLLVQNFGKLCGWQTVSDFIRYACNYQIQRLHALEPAMPRTFLGGLMMAQEVLGTEAKHREMEAFFNRALAEVNRNVQSGDYGEVARILCRTHECIRRCEERAWKRRFLERFDKLFAHWLPKTTVEAPKELPGATQPADVESPGTEGDVEE